MQFFLLGIVVIILVLLALRSFAHIPANQLAKLIKRTGGILVIAIGAFMTLRGLAVVGVPVIAAGLGMLRGGFGLSGIWANRTRKSQGQQSRVRSTLLEMELYHDTGAMDGTVLRGNFEGSRLSGLTPEQLLELHTEFLSAGDQQAVALLEAYLDRMHPQWSQSDQQRSSRQSPGGATADRAMTRDQAFEILGLQEGASEAEIKSAHRTLMLKLHPDHGGSTYLASKINEAKDFLLAGK